MALPVKFKDLSPELRKNAADEILDRYDNEETIADIAKGMNISPRSIYGLLLAECPERWKHSHAARLMHELDIAKQGMKDAKDNLDLGRYKELAARHAWELERLANRIYGQKVEAVPMAPVHININMGGGRLVNDSQAEEVIPTAIDTAKRKAAPIRLIPLQEASAEGSNG